jgi:translation initiation factor 6
MPFKFLKTNFNTDPNIGLYGFATDEYCLLGSKPKKKIFEKIKKTVGVVVKVSTVGGSELAGLFSVGNKNGIILTKIVEEYELKRLKKMFDVNIGVLKSKETAIGNLIVCNDKGCLISKSLKKYRKKIFDILDVEVEVGRIAGLDIVGSITIASNRGCLCHRDANEDELKMIEELLKVKADIGTVSYGSPFVKSGIIVNSNGVIFSEQTTGPEMGRIEEVFK